MAKSAEAELKKMLEADSKTRASQYSAYYTDMGWQRWDISAAVVAQRIAEEKLQFQEASDMYQKEVAALEKRRGDLQKRLADISIKKASAQIKREDAEWKERNKRYMEVYKGKSKQARDKAYVPSTSYSYGWSESRGTGTGSTVRAAGGRDALDEALDEVGADAGLTSKQAISAATSASTDILTAAAQLKDIKARQKNGQLDSTQYGAGVTLYGAHRYMVSKLAQTLNQPEDEIETLLNSALADKEIDADVKFGAQAVLDRATMGTGSGGRTSDSGREGTSTGGYYGKYNLPPMKAIVPEAVDLKPLETAEAEVKAQIEATAGQVPKKPVLEPIDIITATRNEYMQKFGEAPRGTSLQMGGETIGKYKNLMPYELTNALGKVKTFFGNYIQSELATAKAAAAGRELTTDEFNAAVELGKKRAREVLFSGLAARDPEYAKTTSTDTAVAGATSAAANVVGPSDQKGWDSVGVIKPNTGNAAADAASYQAAKEAWAATQGVKPQDLQVVKDRITAYNREIIGERKEDIEAIKNMYRTGLPEGMDVGGLKAPSTTEPGVDMEEFFRNRVAPSGATEAELPPLRVGSPYGSFTSPSIGEKQEGMIGPTPTPEARRSIGDILLRGFRPELDRRTGELITPQMSGRDRAEAIAGLDKRGLDQYQNFPESMRPPYPREVGGEVFRPLSASEFPAPRPQLNKLDRAALGIPETPVGDIMGSEVLGGDLGAGDRARVEGLRKRQELQDQLESLKSRREFMNEAERSGSQPSPMDEALREEKKRKLQEQLDSMKSRKEFMDTAEEAGKKQGASLEKRDVTAKTLAILSGTKLATENPAAAGKLVNKDAIGKYIAALYDENKIKGANAKPLGELTQTIIREYAGDSTKQKKAVEILSSLAALDATSGKINA